MTGRQAVYHTQTWYKLISLLRSERVNDKGELICEHCGKPIVHKYDCIAHHIIELTDDNYMQAEIAYNPENIMLVHFACHNAIHERFGYSTVRKVYIVHGSPCAGKTTWVQQNAGHNAIVLDIDRLWSAIRSPSCGSYEKPNVLKQNIFGLRDTMIEQIKVRLGKWSQAFVIGGYPMLSERERLADMLGAELIHIDTDRQTCESRAAERPREWLAYIAQYWERYSPPLQD